jgi:hypothetical protein
MSNRRIWEVFLVMVAGFAREISPWLVRLTAVGFFDAYRLVQCFGQCKRDVGGFACENLGASGGNARGFVTT